jgi:hypothetical protein
MKKISIFAWLLAGMVTISSAAQSIPLFNNFAADSGLAAILNTLVIIALRPVFAALAALIVSRHPRNAVGWLLFLPAMGFIFNVEPYIRSFTAAPEQPPFLLLLSLWYATTSWLGLIFPIFFIMVLYPTGRPPSPRWRWLIRAGLGMCAFFVLLVTFGRTYNAIDYGRDWQITNPIGFIELGENEGLFFILWGFGLISNAILSVVSLIVRFRRAAAVEREQIKWLLFACAVFAASYGISYPINTLPEWSAYRTAANLLWQVSMIGIPVSIAIAILRYRLWDINVLIRRTLVYAGLSATLAVVFLGSVTLFQMGLTAVTGQRSEVATVLSTLLIAALFTPLRRRIQNDIDRRFFRKKYDAEKTLADFSASLRQEVDLNEMNEQLLAVVEESVQPEKIVVWMKSPSNRQQGVGG